MAKKKLVGRIVGLVAGLLIVAGAVYCVFCVDWKKDVVHEPPPIRPLKTMVIHTPVLSSGGKYPGRVKASQEVDLAFQVGGPLIKLPVKNGEEVKEGQLLARIDDRDFKNELDSAIAEVKKTEVLVKRMEKSVKTGGVSKTDLSNAQAAYDKAKATEKIKRKALEDTFLYAKFSGRVANIHVENFENVQAKQSILSLQDISNVEIVVAIPEARVAAGSEKDKDKYRFVATFDYFKGREFELEVKEFSTEADSLTQTYEVTFFMPAPEDVTIFPGMTATVHEFTKAENKTEGAGYIIPLDLVPIDGQGQYYVWRLVQNEGDIYEVRRRDVKVGEIIRQGVFIKDGLQEGDRIAAAGVSLLQEGQKVRLLEENGGGEAQ